MVILKLTRDSAESLRRKLLGNLDIHALIQTDRENLAKYPFSAKLQLANFSEQRVLTKSEKIRRVLIKRIGLKLKYSKNHNLFNEPKPMLLLLEQTA